MLEDLTLISCSFNTPHVLTMLRSFVKHHGDGQFNAIIMENSTNEDMRSALAESGVYFINNAGGTHSRSIDELIATCNTRYALLVDSDIVFQQSIEKLLQVMKDNNGTIMGEVCGDRGGYLLNKRVHPWFCLINVTHIKDNKIRFHDQKRIDLTNSNYFYENVPLNPFRHNARPLYDVASTFYEDIVKAKLKVLEANGIKKYFNHYEGGSWQRQSGHEHYINSGNAVYEEFLKEAKLYEGVSIKGKFKVNINTDVENKKVIFIQPLFVPNDDFLEINKKSVMSCIAYHKQFRFRNIKFVFGGWCKEDRYWEELKGIIGDFGICERFDQNYGKAYIVNNLYKKHFNKEDFLFTLDSDICFDIEEYDIIRRLIRTANRLPVVTQHQMGMIAVNQKDACCHIFNVMDNKLEIEGETLVWSSTGTGVAGGCLFINTKSFDHVGGYRVMGVYAGDDGFLLHDMNRNNFSTMISKTISVIHPSDNTTYSNKNYIDWKHSNCRKCLTTIGKALTEEELKKDIEETNKSWEKGFK